MSQSLIIDVLFHGLAVALSPEAIVCVILILLTDRARTNGLAYLCGWVAGLVLVAAIVLVADDLVAGAPGQMQKPTLGGVIRLTLGVLLIGLGARRALRWLRHAQPRGEPKWLALIEGFGPVRCFIWGFVLSGINPKNVALTVSGAAHFMLFDRAWQTEAVAVAAFVVLASSTIAAPVLLCRAMGPRIQPRLHRLRAWLIGHSDAVLAVLLILFAAKLIYDGVEKLLQ